MKRAIVIKLFLIREAVLWSWPGPFLNVLFLLTAGLDLGPGCVGSLQALSSLSCWEFYTETGGSHWRGQEGLATVPAGYMEANHLILCVINICTYKGYLDPMQVYKESLLFSDRYILFLLWSYWSSYVTHVLRSFWEMDFLPTWYLGEDCSPHGVISPSTVAWSLVSFSVPPPQVCSPSS